MNSAFFVVMSLIATQPGQTVSPADRAENVLAQKMRMSNRYIIKLRIESRAPNAPPPLDTASAYTIHLWRDGNKFRVDHLDALYTPPRAGHDRRERGITCENCEREGYGITTVVLPGPPPTQPEVEFHRLGTYNFNLYGTHIDWRYFGLNNTFLKRYANTQVAADYRDFFSQSDVAVRTASRGMLPCLIVSKKLDQYEEEIWLSERDGYHPILFTVKDEIEGVPDTRTTEIKWQRIPGGHLFPLHVKSSTTIGPLGGRFCYEEDISVLYADFESAIDPTVFSLAGLGLNENQAIGFPEIENNNYPLWRKGKVDYKYTSRELLADAIKSQPSERDTRPMLGAEPAVYPGHSNTTLIVSIVAAVLAVGTAIAAVVIRRRRRGAAA